MKITVLIISLLTVCTCLSIAQSSSMTPSERAYDFTQSVDEEIAMTEPQETAFLKAATDLAQDRDRLDYYAFQESKKDELKDEQTEFFTEVNDILTPTQFNDFTAFINLPVDNGHIIAQMWRNRMF